MSSTNVVNQVVYSYTDGSTLTKAVNSATSNNNGTYAIAFADGTSDTLVWSGSGNSATGVLSTGSTPGGTAYQVGTGKPASTSANSPCYVEAALNSGTTWYGVISDGTTATKTASSSSTSGANTTVSFSDYTTFTHS